MKDVDEPKNLCVDTGTIEHSSECKLRWSEFNERRRCVWIYNDAQCTLRCTLTYGHEGHHVYPAGIA